jgi:hypothetical protein
MIEFYKQREDKLEVLKVISRELSFIYETNLQIIIDINNTNGNIKIKITENF